MGKPDLKTAAGDSPHTRCSNCETVFEVSPELLSSADTRVRCGECLSIFDARNNLCKLPPELTLVDTSQPVVPTARRSADPLHKDASGEGIDNEDFYGSRSAARPAPSAVGHSDTTPQDIDRASGAEAVHSDLDATYADFDLFSGDAELPEVAYFDQASDESGIQPSDGESDHDETFSDTLFAQDAAIGVEALAEDSDESDGGSPHDDASVVDFARIEDDDTPREDLVFNYQESDVPAKQPESSIETSKQVPDVAVVSEGFLSSAASSARFGSIPRNPWLFRGLLALSLMLLLSALFTYRHRDNLHNNPTVRPLLIGVCSVLGCHVPSRVSIDDLRLIQRSVSSHPEIDDALTIKLAFENTADFPQRYPVLVIRLSDTTGDLVARRDFPPAEYLENWQSIDTVASGEQIDVTLEIRDPGETAMSFELDFQPY